MRLGHTCATCAGAPFDDGEHQSVCRVEPSAEGNGACRTARPLSGYCHCGMGRAAAYLGAKFAPLLLPLYHQGLRVTLVGHSLGAGGRPREGKGEGGGALRLGAGCASASVCALPLRLEKPMQQAHGGWWGQRWCAGT